MKFLDYNEILRAIGKSNREVRKLLKDNNIPLHEFLDFVENGASKDDIQEYFKKISKEKTKMNSKENDLVKIDKKQRLLEVPFEEFVHKIPMDKKYDLDFQDSEVYRPARDSPMVTTLSESRPVPKRKQEPKEQSATILSMSFEEQKKKEKKKISKHNLLARNKLVSGDKPKMYSDQSSQESQLTPYQQLGLMFPMKGILIFCGVLGGFTIVTIIIMIIYGSVKCKQKKPVANNYKVSERIELTNEQCQ